MVNLLKIRAIELREKGKSYTEIGKELSVAKSTLSGWLGKMKISPKAQKRIAKRVYEGSLRGLIRRNKNQTHLAIERMNTERAKGRSDIKNLSIEDLKLIGIALYWAEGYKRPQMIRGRERTHHPVSLTNSDPKLIALYLLFLRKVCGVKNENIKADIRIFKGMDQNEILKFWQKITNLPADRFGKIYTGVSISSKGKRPFNRLPYGTILIRVNDTPLFHRVMGWIEGVAKFGSWIDVG